MYRDKISAYIDAHRREMIEDIFTLLGVRASQCQCDDLCTALLYCCFDQVQVIFS